MSKISEHAIVDPSAVIADDVTIGPWTMIGPNVEIAEGTEIGSHTVIAQDTKIGKNNKIFSFVSLGDHPQDINYAGEKTELIIGDNNTIREYVSINRGSPRGHKLTKVGNDNFFMSYSHVAHDCDIGNHVIFVNNATLGGHVQVDDHATIGGFSVVHQFCRIGAHSFLGRAAKVARDVLPYTLVIGDLGSTHGLNTVGLKRHGFTDETLRELKNAYQLIFRRGVPKEDMIKQLKEMANGTPEIGALLEIIETSERGYTR